MARKNITRTITTSTINACRLTMENGKPVAVELPALTINGKVSEERAMQELRKVHGKTAAVAVTSIDVRDAEYTISVEDFLRYAKRVDEPAAVEDKPAPESAAMKVDTAKK